MHFIPEEKQVIYSFFFIFIKCVKFPPVREEKLEVLEQRYQLIKHPLFKANDSEGTTEYRFSSLNGASSIITQLYLFL